MFQLKAQAMRPRSFVCVAGYSECGPGFVPPEKAWDERDSNLESWCWVGRGCEAKMDTAIRRALVGG